MRATSCPGLKDLYPKSLRASKTSSGAAVKRWIYVFNIHSKVCYGDANKIFMWVCVCVGGTH